MSDVEEGASNQEDVPRKPKGVSKEPISAEELKSREKEDEEGKSDLFESGAADSLSSREGANDSIT